MDVFSFVGRCESKVWLIEERHFAVGFPEFTVPPTVAGDHATAVPRTCQAIGRELILQRTTLNLGSHKASRELEGGGGGGGAGATLSKIKINLARSSKFSSYVPRSHSGAKQLEV